MNEASAGRLALAQQLASYYRTNPKVAAVLVEGSVARGHADRFSDIDLAVFWSGAPTEKERSDIIKHARGRHVQLFLYNRDEVCWSDTYDVSGGIIDVRHMGVETTHRILADVLERYDPRCPNSGTLPHSSRPCHLPTPLLCSPPGSSKRTSTHTSWA